MISTPPSGDATPFLDAILDANVLIPASLRDTLLRTAEAELYRPLWSARILEEVRSNLVANHLTDARGAERLIVTMRVAFPEAEIAGYDSLIEQMTNAWEDRHILGAAVASRASIIVTHNLRDFPTESLAPFSVRAQSPDDFLANLFHEHPATIVRIVEEQARDLTRSRRSAEQVLDTLARHAPRFVALVRERRGGIPAGG